MRLLTISASLLALAAALPAQAASEVYDLDSSHTNVLFFISHVGFSDMVGRFQDVSGQWTFDPAKPEAGKVDVTMKPALVQTSSTKLNEHLQTPDFFNSAKFPEIHFVSTAVKATGPADGDVTGNLTLLGVTKPVTLKVHFNKAGYYPITGLWGAGFTATGTLKRSDFGMSKYVPMVGDEVRIVINTEGTAKTHPPEKKK